MKCIEIQRRYGTHGTTRVIITTADGGEYAFNAGRHVSARKIYEIARTLKLKEIGMDDNTNE